MTNYKKIIELVSRHRTPSPSKDFWRDFDKGLRQKLDAVDIQKSQKRSTFVERIKDALELFLQRRLRPAVVTVFLIVMIIGATLFFTNYQGIRFSSIAALSDEELVDELIIIDRLTTEISQAPQKGEDVNGLLDELELLYEINPSLQLS